jgi:hypothetical protein
MDMDNGVKWDKSADGDYTSVVYTKYNLDTNNYEVIKADKVERQSKYADKILSGDYINLERGGLVGCRKSKVELIKPDLEGYDGSED